jgi:predicted Zn-ribbon and HTH transcriptional regulator
MTRRRDLLTLLARGPRTASSLARELGFDRRDIEAELRHAVRSARAEGHHLTIEPARCKDCGFLFSADKLTKPGRCPSCKGSRVFEALLQLTPPPGEADPA